MKKPVAMNPAGSWEPDDIDILVRQLRRSMRPLNSREEIFFSKLVEQFRVAPKPQDSLSAEKLLELFKLPDDPISRQEVYDCAHDLKKEIEGASNSIKPSCPGASIDHYRLTVSNYPPRLLKKYAEPTIALLLADISDWFVGEFIKGIKEVSGHKYNLIVETSNYDPRLEAEKMESLAERVHGLLVVPGW